MEDTHNLRSVNKLKDLIEKQYSIKITKKGNSFIVFPSETLIHIRGSKILYDKEGEYGFYHFFKNNFESLLNSNKSFFAIVYDNPEITFLIPKDSLTNIFKNDLITDESESPRWYFYFRSIDNKYFIDFRKKSVDKIDITNYLNKWDQIDDITQIDKRKVQYFLVQVNRPGSENIINFNKYDHYNWQKTPRDIYHGEVKEGDKLLVYFARNSINYKKQLKKIYRVKQVSEKNEYFDLIEEMELNGLTLKDIKNGIQNGKLRKEVFDNLSQQGFNIIKIDTSDYDSVISLDKELIKQMLEPSLWLIRAGDKGQGAQTALKNNYVGIGYGGLPGLHLIKDYEKFKEHYKTHPEDSINRVGKVVRQIWDFMREVKVGDFVLLPLGLKSNTMAVGKISGEYQYEHLHSEIEQYRPVHWLKRDVNIDEFDPEIQQSFDDRGTVHYIGGLGVVNKLKDMLKRLEINEVDLESIDHVNNKIIPIPYNKNDYDIENKWLSLKDIDIEEIAQKVLTAKNKRLEIDENIVKRIISHLMVSKHVILVGPPGTGKTDLARRILRELGNKIIDNPEPIEAIASYEWGRYVLCCATMKIDNMIQDFDRNKLSILISI